MTKDDKWILTNHIMLFDSEAEINKLIKKTERGSKIQTQAKTQKASYEFIKNNSIIANELFFYYSSESKKLKKKDYIGYYTPMLSFLN